ncbi:MAG: class I SAM-dependent methyltransferase [Thermoplasmata archaeon]|nr:class I SAM-dependent methyltransferase [Thermoplasmata archaeon]
MNFFLRWLINRRNVARSARLLGTIAPHLTLSETSRTLELGAGLGGLSALVFDRYRPQRVVVTDFDANQLEVARRFLTDRYRGLPDGFELATADALALAFPDASFDAVFAMGVLHHVEARHFDFVRRPEALREIRRVLAPGGSLVYTEFSRPDEVRRVLGELGFTPLLAAHPVGHEELNVFRAPSS